jgi:NAD(P)-dependent dehydrogenase (short-subunit alcohol dehydrogenase family)
MLLVVALVAGLAGGLIAKLTTSSTRARATAGNRGTCVAATVAHDVLPSVVTILTTTADGGSGNGSGELIRQGEYVLTNDHVVSPGADGGEVWVAVQRRHQHAGDHRRPRSAHRPGGREGGRGRGPTPDDMTLAPDTWHGPLVPSETPVALVTGAGRGIGRAVAVRLSTQGYRVALTARSEDELRETADRCDGETLVLPADITSTEAIGRIFDAVEDAWGGVDVLVANAGAGTSAPLAKTTDEQWAEMLDLNLTAPFRCIRRAVPGMLECGHGRIVVVASIAAKVGEPYASAYTASKHGILGVVRSAAAELAGKGITVNAVCPGYVDTPMTDRTVSRIADRTGRSPEDVRAVLAAKQPTGRLITPEEVADAVWLCVTNAALNGQGIDVDGEGAQS